MTEIVKSVGRIFDVMEHFEAVRAPMSLKDMTDHFRWPTSSTAALLKSLVMRGYLDYDRFGRSYMPTMRMATLGNWVEDALFGSSHLNELMYSLSDLTGETISLGVQSDLYAQHIHVIPAQHAMQVVLRPGTVRPLLRSGLGALLLSVRDDDTIDIIRRRCNIEDTSGPQVSQEDLLRRVNEIRARGYMFARNTFVNGTAIIGMLASVRPFKRLMTINVLGPTERLLERRESIVATMRAGFASDQGGDGMAAVSGGAAKLPLDDRKRLPCLVDA